MPEECALTAYFQPRAWLCLGHILIRFTSSGRGSAAHAPVAVVKAECCSVDKYRAQYWLWFMCLQINGWKKYAIRNMCILVFLTLWTAIKQLYRNGCISLLLLVAVAVTEMTLPLVFSGVAVCLVELVPHWVEIYWLCYMYIGTMQLSLLCSWLAHILYISVCVCLCR